MDTAAQVLAALELANAIIAGAGKLISASKDIWSTGDLAAARKALAETGSGLDAARAEIDADAA